MRFLAVRKKIHEVGFDNFHQAGCPNKFHPLNIVCESKALNLQVWVCADGGYGVSETYHIASRPLDNDRAPTRHINFSSQEEMIRELESVRLRIAEAKCLKNKRCEEK